MEYLPGPWLDAGVSRPRSLFPQRVLRPFHVATSVQRTHGHARATSAGLPRKDGLPRMGKSVRTTRPTDRLPQLFVDPVIGPNGP